MVTRVRARPDGSLGARIVARRPLYYAGGADPGEDRPAHVRAGSGLVRFDTGFAVVQDDADFVALIDGASGAVQPVALPRRGTGARQFEDERGNKADKLDFEACIVAEIRSVETLLAFGSGSTPARESVLVFERGGAVPRIVRADGLYAALRREHEFSGSELNVEGAVVIGDVLRLFQRGNGAFRGDLSPVNATCDLPLSCVVELAGGRPPVAPSLREIAQFDLGSVSGIPFTFTDATVTTSGDVMYVAAAEGSPDAVRDGVVVGAALGVIRKTSGRIEASYAPLLDESGKPAVEKAEGIAFGETSNHLYLVLDADDPRRASELCLVELTGPW
jgi:hypothetical protein